MPSLFTYDKARHKPCHSILCLLNVWVNSLSLLANLDKMFHLTNFSQASSSFRFLNFAPHLGFGAEQPSLTASPDDQQTARKDLP